MKVISRKSEVQPILEECISAYHTIGLHNCVQRINDQLLCNPVKFPLLEYCGYELFLAVRPEEHVNLCNAIEQLNTEGGNVLLGTILQRRLEDHFEASLEKAVDYISNATIWHAPDIIGERVFGVALLKMPDQTILKLKILFLHPSNWVIRSLGAGIHYAIKQGLREEHVQQLFTLLLKNARHPDKEVRQGVGWAAKTTAKFHPSLIELHAAEINNPTLVDNWFRTKVLSALHPPQKD